MYLRKEFTFDAAHSLRHMGKCEKLHGHTYRLVVTLEGTPDSNGIIIDFQELEKIVSRYVLSELDHTHLNRVIDNPTTENVVRWIARRLELVLRGENYRLHEIELFESQGASIIYKLNDERRSEGD